MKTAKQYLDKYSEQMIDNTGYNEVEALSVTDAEKAVKEYARQVAIGVRKECAKKSPLIEDNGMPTDTYRHKNNILNIDIEKFIK